MLVRRTQPENILAIDTSTDVTYVALSLSDFEKEIELSSKEGNHDGTLVSLVNEAFNSLGVKFNVLNQILIGAGPGSFTGLRIGFSFVSGFAQALGIRPQAIISLRAYAEEFRKQGRVIVTLADARRSEYFFASYTGGEDLKQLIMPTIYNVDTLQDYLIKLESSGVKREDILLVYTGDIELPIGYKSLCPQDLANDLIKVSKNDEFCEVCEPLYIRKVAAKTIAERELEAKNKR